MHPLAQRKQSSIIRTDAEPACDVLVGLFQVILVERLPGQQHGYNGNKEFACRCLEDVHAVGGSLAGQGTAAYF